MGRIWHSCLGGFWQIASHWKVDGRPMAARSRYCQGDAMKRRCQLLALSLLALAAPAWSSNLVVNPDFDDGLAGWTGAQPYWQINTADGSGTAPSAQFVV